jgi:hypothetical protein
VIDHEVGDKVVLSDGRDASGVVTESGEEGAHGKEGGIRDEDLLAVTSVEDERVGIEVWEGENVGIVSAGFGDLEDSEGNARLVPLGYQSWPEALLKR